MIIKVSVVIPVYNVEKYLEACVRSVMNQKLKEIEIILVDDGSLDNSGTICDELAFEDDRIKVIHKKNGGLSSARNAGLQIAKGKYVGFVDSDDYIHEDMYNKMFSKAQENESDIVSCALYEVIGDEIKLSKKVDDADYVLSKYGVDNFIINKMDQYRVSCCTKIFKLDTLNKYSIRFISKEITPSEDTLFNYKMLAVSENVSLISNPLYFYIRRIGSITNTEYDNTFPRKMVFIVQLIKEFLNLNKVDFVLTKALPQLYYTSLETGLNNLNNKSFNSIKQILEDIYKSDNNFQSCINSFKANILENKKSIQVRKIYTYLFLSLYSNGFIILATILQWIRVNRIGLIKKKVQKKIIQK